ncbi:unnamed protein product [Coregonus sp. 'balchen']|nr:unnamed protein product [Coregonus sp. 'balchen']
MLSQKISRHVRPGSLQTLHQINHLSSRTPIACDHHTTHRNHIPLWVATLSCLRPSLPVKSTLCFQPCRPASTTSGRGWSTMVGQYRVYHRGPEDSRNTATESLSGVEALKEEIAELAKRLRYEISVRAKYQFKKNLKRIVSELYVRDNCHPFKASLLVWVQLPMWVCLSLALRILSLVTELAVGGALWFSDLTLPDSTWIIPVFALQRIEASRFQKYSMALYWLSSICVGLGHNLLLRSPRFRRLCHIPSTRPDSDTP